MPVASSGSRWPCSRPSRRRQGLSPYRRTDLDTDAQDKIVTVARRLALLRVPFDDAFDLGDGRAVDCTELVVRASAEAGVPLRDHIDGNRFRALRRNVPDAS